MAQLDESKTFDLEVAGAIPLCATTFLPTMFALAYVYASWDPNAEWLKQNERNRAYLFETDSYL